MNKPEVKKLFLIINSCYPNFEYDDFKTEVWLSLLKDVHFETGQRNLKDHIASSRFLPTPSDIICKLPLIDKEIESRNHDIAFSQFVRGGGKPEDFIYVRDRAAGVKELGS